MTKRQRVVDVLENALTDLEDLEGQLGDWRPAMRIVAEEIMELTDTGKPLWNVLTERAAILPEDPKDAETIRNRMFVNATTYEECERVIALYRSVNWRAPYSYLILPHEQVKDLYADWSEGGRNTP